MKEQQIEYENRIRQLRIDLGALKDAYLKLEKNHVGKPDKLKRVLLEKNRQINSFQQENEKLKNEQDGFEKEKQRVGKQLEDEKKKLDEEKLKNIMLQRDVSKLCKFYDIKIAFENYSIRKKNVLECNSLPSEKVCIAIATDFNHNRLVLILRL